MTRLRRALLGLLVAGAVLAAIEGVARLASGPPVVPVVVRMPDGSEGLFTTDPVTPKLVEHQAWWPQGPKDPARPRIVMLGGSSLAGPPQDARLAANQLAGLLDAEVVNLGVGGMDTGHLLAELPGVLALDPDLVVVYSGHNDLGNAVFSQRYAEPGAVAVARVRQVLGHSRVYELLEAAWRGREEKAVVVQWDSRDMALGAAEKAAVLSDQEARLGALLDGLRQAGVPVLLSTVVSNAFFPSVHWECPERLEALGVPASRTAILPVGEVDAAALAAARAEAPCRDLDQVAARLQWVEDPAAAAEALQRLRDEDPKPLRAPRRVNAILRELAGDGVELVDSAAEFQRLGGGVEPPGWFRDPVHFSEDGHRALAVVLARAAGPLLGRPVQAELPTVPLLDPTACLSERCPRPRRGKPPPPQRRP